MGWEPMRPQPHVVDGVLGYSEIGVCVPAEVPGTRFRLRTMWLHGWEVQPDLSLLDHHGNVADKREVGDLVKQYGADFVTWRVSDWPPSEGPLIAGDQWPRRRELFDAWAAQ